MMAERASEAISGPALPMSRLLGATLLLAMVGPSLTFVTLPPSLPLIAEHFGGGDAGRGIAQAAPALSFVGGVVGGLAAGMLIARLGLYQVLIASAAIYGLGGLIAMLAHVPAMLFAGCFAVGVTGSLLSSGLAMGTGAVTTGERRARMLGYQAATSDVTGVMIGLCTGLLAIWLGWRGPFTVYIAFGLIATLLVIASRPHAVPSRAGGEGNGMIAAVRLAWPVYCGSLLLSMLIGTLQLQLPFHLADHGIRSSADRALIQTFATAAAACASISFGALTARLGERRLLAIGGGAALSGFAGFALWHGGFWGAAAASAAAGLAIGIGVPLLFTFALRATPPAQHAYSIGILNVTIFLGGAVSPLVLGPVAQAGGMKALFATCAVIAAIGTAVFLIALRRKKPARPWTGATRATLLH